MASVLADNWPTAAPAYGLKALGAYRPESSAFASRERMAGTGAAGQAVQAAEHRRRPFGSFFASLVRCFLTAAQSSQRCNCFGVQHASVANPRAPNDPGPSAFHCRRAGQHRRSGIMISLFPALGVGPVYEVAGVAETVKKFNLFQTNHWQRLTMSRFIVPQ